MVRINTVDYETIKCYPQNCQKNPLPTSYFSPLIEFNLLLRIKIIWSSSMGYQTFINRILLSEIFLNTHSCNLVKIQVSFLDSLYRNQFSVKQILFQKFCLPQKFLSYLKAGKNLNVKLINCRLLEPQNLTFTR